MHKTLYQTPYIELRRVIDHENDITGYDYVHETRCNGAITAILPYRIKNDVTEYLLRHEVTPCWHVSKKIISSITGGVEAHQTPLENTIQELEEEAGYIRDKNEFISLGTMRGTKSSDTTYHLFTINLTDVERNKSPDGDGSALEKKAHCEWHKNINNAKDPLIYALHYKKFQYGIHI